MQGLVIISNVSSRAKRGICILLFAATSYLSFAQIALPPSWRKPTATETTGAWRSKSPTRFLAVKVDFDGDAKPDMARLLVNASGNQCALFVLLGATGKWQMLGEPTDAKWLDRYGIDLVKPGKYETACGKGYDESFCAHGEPNFLKLSTSAIDMFVEESADSIFYWDKSKKKFVEIQMSD